MENQELNSECEALRKEIDDIRRDYDRAKRLLQDVNDFVPQFDKVKKLLDDEKIDEKVQLTKERIREVGELKEQAQDSLTSISNDLKKVGENIESMRAAYADFTGIQGRVSGVSGEIDTLLNGSRSLQKDIEQTKLEAQQTLESIKTAFSDVQKKTQDMQSAYENFLQIKGKIDDENSGLNAIFNAAQGLKTKSEAIYKEIQSFRDESKQLLIDIKGNKEFSDTTKEEISKNLEDVLMDVKAVKKVTALITDTGFANAFRDRAKKLFRGYVFWGAILGVSVIALTFLIIYFFKDQSADVPAPSYVIYRLALTSPLLLLIGFSITQYKKERDLNEKYEFKAVSATVLRKHIEFLIEKFGAANGANEFACKTFAKIYKEPYSDGSYGSSKNKCKESSVVGKSKAIKEKVNNLKEFVDSVESLKSLVKDDETLKTVLEILYSKK